MLTFTVNSISTSVPQDMVDDAKSMAELSAAKYNNLVLIKKSPYHQNTVHSHFIGKIGEIGAALAFTQMGDDDIVIDEVFRDVKRDSECDLIINNLRVEIKCWKPYAIDLYGPCISDRQAKKLYKKCDVVVYCTFDERTNQFDMIGWNNMDDIANTESILTGPVDKPEKHVLNRKMNSRSMHELPIFQTISFN